MDSDADDDVWSANKFLCRRASLTYTKPLGSRNSFHNRSLQDFSDRIKFNTDDELELQKQKLSILNPVLQTDPTPSASSDSPLDDIDTDNSIQEWKQVMDEYKAEVFARIHVVNFILTY